MHLIKEISYYIHLLLQYFTVSQGIQNFVLDLYDNDKETSFDIYTDIKSILGKYKLELKI